MFVPGILALLLLSFPGAPVLHNQASSPGLNRADEQHKLLELRRAQLLLENKRSIYENKKELFQAHLLSKTEVEAARMDFLQAQIGYQEAFLRLFGETSRLSVLKAEKSLANNGDKRVTVTLENRSGADLDYRRLGVPEADMPLPDRLRLREIDNIFVSLKDKDGVVISDPYEVFVPQLEVSEKKKLSFALLKDVDSLTVSMTYGGKTDEREVFLKKDASVNLVIPQSEQLSQEVDLGGEATYDLKLERFTAGSGSFVLETLGLPAQIDRAFLLSSSASTRVNQLHFNEGETTKEIALRLYLPEVVNGSSVTVDRSISFWVVVVPQALSARFAPRRSMTKSEIEKIPAGKIELQIIPRGVPRLDVIAANLYQEIAPDRPAQFSVLVQNTGTRGLSNVKVSAVQPLDWSSSVRPDLILRLEAGAEQRVLVDFIPGEEVEVGDYSAKIQTEARAGNRSLRSEDKSVRIRISEPLPVWRSVLLVCVLLLVVMTMVIAGVKIARR